MDVRDIEKLPDDPEQLKQLLLDQQRQFSREQHNAQLTINQQQRLLERQKKEAESSRANAQQLNEKVVRQKTRIEILEDQLRQLRQHQFGERSEKLYNPNQSQLFNEAEIIADDPADTSDGDDEASITVPEHTRKRKRRQGIPDELERVDVVHDLDESDRQCSACHCTLEYIGEDVSEQLCVIPQQLFAIRHRRKKYACCCKECIRTATMPVQPLPGSQASARLLADIMVRKYLDGLPLYRQEKIAQREGLDLPRDKLARWVIGGSEVFQPILNLLEDTFFGYDIALSDDTGIRVLKENGRMASSKSALWIRRGGPPDKPVVLVDYEISKSGETAYRLLSELRGYLVTDGADNFNLSVQRNNLVQVLCNDHSRRRFRRALDGIAKDKRGGSIAQSALSTYGKLYRIEAEIKHLTPAERYQQRQERSVPLWKEFIEWAERVFTQGVAHGKTTEALSYLLKHKQGLQNYCIDGRLPISNILAEHVAKTIAISRKNFLFSDTPSGATASARVFSLIETARANGHNPHRFLSVLLTELPQATSIETIEALLPWAITPDEINKRFAAYPTP